MKPITLLLVDDHAVVRMGLASVTELSARQREIRDSIVRCLPNPDIARQLGISLPMVKEHITSLFAELGAANRTEAVVIALRKQLLKI